MMPVILESQLACVHSWRTYNYVETDEEVKELVAMADSHHIEAWGYITDTTQQVERAMQFGFTNLTANDPHAVIDYLNKTNRRSER